MEITKQLALVEDYVHLTGGKGVKNNEWLAKCPVPSHGKGKGDSTPSLSIKFDDGKFLVRCFAGCQQEELWACFVGKTGLPTGGQPKSSGKGPQVPWVAVAIYRHPSDSPKTVRRYDHDGIIDCPVPRCENTDRHKHITNGIGGNQGFYVLLWEPSGSVAEDAPVFLVEGEKTAEYVRSAGFVSASWLGGSGNVMNADFSTLKGRDVVLCPDNDEAGITAMQRAYQQLDGIARSVKSLQIHPSAEAGDDLADLPKDELVRYLSDPVFEEPKKGSVAIVATTPFSDQFDTFYRSVLGKKKDDGTPIIYRNDIASVCEVRKDNNGREIKHVLVKQTMFKCLSDNADWVVPTDKGERLGDPKMNVVEGFVKNPHHDMPVLDAIYHYPVVRNEGNKYNIVSERGFYNQHNILMCNDSSFDKMDVQEAVALIDDLFSDFPFSEEYDRANLYAYMLNGLVRSLSDISPFFVFRKPSPGTGASKLSRIAAWISTGSKPNDLQGPSGDATEDEKRLLGFLRVNQSGYGLIDNFAGEFSSPVYARVATQDSVTLRVITTPDMATVSTRHLTIAVTSNNATFSAEMQRRIIPILIDAKVPKPWERPLDTFKYPDIERHVSQNIQKYQSAVLSIVQHWIDEGAPTTPQSRPVC